ncbi:sulfite exporter TauE/SafE family protein [Salirhabdus euzebyi]|nr:sulfite exporter TauE/SafE family protein [Salirhabdus euzebyi]
MLSSLIAIGIFAGAYGAIVGAGGGFIFVPALLIFYQFSPAVAAGTGLLIVFINSLSGVFGLIKQKRIYYYVGIILTIGAIPGTFFGSWLAEIIPAASFYKIFAILLILLSGFLFYKNSNIFQKNKGEDSELEKAFLLEEGIWNKQNIGFLGIGYLLGTVSNFFGIGGGWLMVPILVYGFKIKPHIATATSLFTLCIYSFVGATSQILNGNIDWEAGIWGGLGVMVGAQLGVLVSSKLSGKVIIQMLSLLLLLIGARLLFMG